MKRLLPLLLVLAFCLTLLACEKKSKQPRQSSGPAVTDAPTEPETDPDDPFFSACDASQAVAATRLITVTYGDELLAREEIDYDLSAGTYTGERQVRGSADADQTYSVEPLSGAVSDPFGALAFRRADFTDADEQDGRFSGTIDRACLARALGLSADDLPPAARLTLTVTADRLTSLSLTYISSDGNTVEIAYTFSY